MKAPKGMKWIDVTYTARRLEQDDEYNLRGVSEGEAGMRILVCERSAKWLAEDAKLTDSLCDFSMNSLECILRGREELCRGRYVEGSIKDIRIVEDDE